MLVLRHHGSTLNETRKDMRLNERKRVAALDSAYVAKVREALDIIKHPMKVCLNPNGMSDTEARAIAREFAAL